MQINNLFISIFLVFQVKFIMSEILIYFSLIITEKYRYNHVCEGICYFFMPVGARWVCGGIVTCVLNLGLVVVARVVELFIFEFFCSFTVWSCILYLCVWTFK